MEGDLATVPIRKLSSKDPMSSRSRAWRFFRMSLRLIEDSFLHEYLYSYYENKKTPTCQEKYGRVTKKVPKGLNCYHTHYRLKPRVGGEVCRTQGTGPANRAAP